MGLFFKKKKEVSPCACCGGCQAENVTTSEPVQSEAASVKILGGGCAKCNQLEASTKEALEKLGMDTTIEHVTDFAEIATYGVMTTPALVMDQKVLSYGKVLKTDEVVKLIEKNR